ncbi:Protein phosphatase methylesterase 1 [Saitozyma sp. JCM 24511]|nr:Protein phosphatase methylesterase 1 [Saitozyma sp. JCM 24511]
MSDNFRKSILNRLPRLPPTRAPWADGDGDGDGSGGGDGGEQEELEGGDTMSQLGAMLPPAPKSPAQDLSPLSASGFFSQALEVTPRGSSTAFRVYLTPPNPQPSPNASTPTHIPTTLAAGPSPPHAGPSGSSSTSPAKATTTTSGTEQGKAKGTYLVCHHGAGAGGLSFAALAKEVTEKSAGEMGVLSYDARGHGKTKSQTKSEETTLTLEKLLEDLMGILEHLFPDPKDAPSLVLMGHSMGAAPILAAIPLLQKKGYSVPGIIVLDVVEGTAVESLPLMKGILSSRPTSFRSVVDAIHWHLHSSSIRNATSARVSVPSYLTPSPDETDPGPQGKQIWRTDLLATEPYWAEWWGGLSQKFLTAKCARMLVLAGQERLDKDLMVGQMQGKFQLEVLQDVGHYLHEDNPAALASLIVTFWRRNTRVLVLPPKIGAPAGSAGAVGVRRVGED